MIQPPVRRAAPEEAGHVAELIATSFEPLDVARWLVPNDSDRIPVLTRNFTIWVRYGIDNGVVHVVEDLSATAIWFDRTAPLAPPFGYEDLLQQACGRYVSRFRSLDAALESHHPERPHHHLAFLAVNPGKRRQGLGSALLHHHHAQLKDLGDGSVAYLEASSTDAVRLYERHGYKCSEPYFLPGGPPFYPMIKTFRSLPKA